MSQIIHLELTNLDFRQIQLEDYEIIKTFKCGNSSLENYLKQNAYYDTIDLLASTNLVFIGENLVGYFTLRKQKLNVDADLDLLDYHFSLDIARLAVSKDFQRNGIGSEIIRRIIDLARSVNERFITLDALIEVHSWYTHRGFTSFIEEEEVRSNQDGLVYMIMDLYDESIVENYLYEEIG
jgi:GNAT superfamily N-acetyltransferase